MSAGICVLVATAALAATSIGTDVTTDGVLSTTGNATLGSDAADLLTLNGTVQNTSLVFEGATADAFETTLAVTDPTADRTITLPDATGNLAVIAGNLAVTAAKTLTASNSLTLAGTDGTTLTFQGTDTYVGRATTDTLTNKTLTAPRIGSVINDTNGVALLSLTATGSAVNGLILANAATGSNPLLEAAGADANIGISLRVKNVSGLSILSSGTNSDQIIIAPNTSGGTSNAGTITTQDLNTGRTWTFPNQDGQVALTANNLSSFAATTSAQLAGVLTDETGTGLVVLGTSPSLTTPTLAGATITTSALTLSGLDPDITTGTNEDLALSPNGTGSIKLNKPVRDAVQSGVANDSGNASPGDFGTVNPATSYLELTCNDADGCTIALDEAAPVAQGQTLTIVNAGTVNAVTLADVAGTTELNASAAYVMGQYDSITLRYTSDRWVETARSNN